MGQALEKLDVRLRPVPRKSIDYWWPHVSVWIAHAILAGGSTWTLDEVQTRLSGRTLQMWILEFDKPFGVILTEIYDTAKGKTCAMPIVGGTRLSLGLLCSLQMIEAWAREQGCMRLEGMGRPGWVRILKEHGWRPVATVIEKDLI